MTSSMTAEIAVLKANRPVMSLVTFSIAQFGSTRSINASAAAAIAMHSWIREYADLSADHAWRG